MLFRKHFKNFYETFLSLKGTPHSLAVSLALGVFVGVTPIIPFRTAAIALFGLLFRQNLPTAYLGCWVISNPLTIPFFYLSQYEMGRFFLGMKRCHFLLDEYSFRAILQLGAEILVPLMTGGLLMALFSALAAYFLSRRVIVALRNKRKP